MKLTIATDSRQLIEHTADGERVHPLYSPAAFALLTRQWLRVGWAQKYSYSYTWLGRPIIQLPQDMVRMQELIARVQPEVIVETGVAHGGSLIFYASLCRLLGRGRVVGIDIDIRAPNRAAIESHPLAELITLIEGSSIDPDVVARARAQVRPGESVLVILDSNHTRDHVAAELNAYAELVTPGSYMVATDGIMLDLHDVPGGDASWRDDHPAAAARAFAASRDDFILEPPPRPFDQSGLPEDATYWPDAWLRRTAR